MAEKQFPGIIKFFWQNGELAGKIMAQKKKINNMAYEVLVLLTEFSPPSPKRSFVNEIKCVHFKIM